MGTGTEAEARDAAAQTAARAFERVAELVNADAALVRRGRYLTADCLVAIGEIPFHLSIQSGRIASLERGPRLMRAWTFAVRGRAAAWLKFWERVPEPGWHDLFALTKRGEAVLEGDLRVVMANLQYVKDVLAAPRRLA